MNKTQSTTPSRPAEELEIKSLSRDELQRIREAINRELESRAFEANLKKELTSYKRRSG